METWIFLGQQWNELSLLRQLALLSLNHRDTTGVNVLSFSRFCSYSLPVLLRKFRPHPENTSAGNLSSIQPLPFFLFRLFLKKKILCQKTQAPTVIFTDNPAFHTLLDLQGKHIIWIYIRPACPKCARHNDIFFLQNDEIMIKKAHLVINDNKIHSIPKHVLDPQDQEKIICTPPMLPLIEKVKQRQPNPEKNIAGFYGPMDEQIETDLLMQSAMALPSWNFELHVTRGKVPEALKSIPNIIIKPENTDTAFFEHWSLALLPFSCTRHRSCSSPPMLIDYIRHGLPIAATPLTLLKTLTPHLAIQKPKEPFMHTIRHALKHPPAKKNNTDFALLWDRLLKAINQTIDQGIREKTH